MFRRAQPQSPTVRDVDAEQLSRNELLAHVEELRKYIGVVTRERDRLQRENEDYINNSVSATFDSSSFLRETLLSKETELQQKGAELKHVKAERDELVEDVAMIKEAKRLSDRSCREVRIHGHVLSFKVGSNGVFCSKGLMCLLFSGWTAYAYQHHSGQPNQPNADMHVACAKKT